MRIDLDGSSCQGGGTQQCISHYVDDSSFMIKEEKRYVDELLRLFKVVNKAIGWRSIVKSHAPIGPINSFTNLFG